MPTSKTQASKKPTRPYKPKVKTGCTSCRTRRVKCDEGKPSCRRCLQTGRTCDGYEDLFRPVQWAPVGVLPAVSGTPAATSSQSKPPPKRSLPSPASMTSELPPAPTVGPTFMSQPSPPLTPQTPAAPTAPPRPAVTREDVTALAMRFTNKHVAEGYEDEARMSLEASLEEPAVRHAIASLTSLYKTLEEHGHRLPHGKPAIPAVYDGLQEYHNAMINLANKLTSRDRRSVEIALVCCRMFISIEVMLKSYMAAARHYFRGITLMHEMAVRPHVDASGKVVLTHNAEFPKIDVFMIKMFCSPDPLSPDLKKAALAIKRGTRLPPKQFVELMRFARTEVRAARVKSKLVAVAELVLQFLDRLSKLQPGPQVKRIQLERAGLVQLLEGVKSEYHGRDGPKDLGPYHGRFLTMFHTALWVPVYCSLQPPTWNMEEIKGLFDSTISLAGRSATDFGYFDSAALPS